MTERQKKRRYWRLESQQAQEFVITEDVDPGPDAGIDLRHWPTRTELSEAEYEARTGERAPDPAVAAAARRDVRLAGLTVGELEDMIDARIRATAPGNGAAAREKM